MSQDREGKILSQFPQPIQEIWDAPGAFEINEFVAVGGGGTDQIGHVEPRVLHGFTVPIDEEVVFLFQTPQSVRFAFS